MPDCTVARVAAHLGLSVDLVLSGEGRGRSVTYARHVAWYLLRGRGVLLKEIAPMFNRHYTTVIQGAARIEAELRAGNVETQYDVGELG